MTLQALPATGPFRGALPFDESSSSVFFGRERDLEGLYQQLMQEGTKVTVLTGVAGVGKTSLLRAGLAPALASQGILGLYVGCYDDLEQELIQAASRVRADPPAAGEVAVEYAARLALSAPSGAVLVLDHLETILNDDGSERERADLAEFLRQLLSASRGDLRLLFSIESGAFHKLGKLLPRSTLAAAGATYELLSFDEEQTAAVVEQTALQTGTFIEAGLANEIAADLSRDGRCLPLDLQMVCRSVMDLRLTSIRRYKRGGGPASLIHAFFERVMREAGGKHATKVLLAVLDESPLSTDEICARTNLTRATAEQALSTFLARGVMGKKEGARPGETAIEIYGIIHPALIKHAADFVSLERAQTQRTRRLLQRRVVSGTRLRVMELIRVRRHLGTALGHAETQVFKRSVRRKIFHAGITLMVALAIFVVVYIDLRTSYTLDQEPADKPEQARVVVRMGRPGRSWLNMLPNNPPFGSILADTGFSTAGLSRDLAERISTKNATGKLERDKGSPVPGWLRTVLSGLRPVQRGTAAVLLGEATGVRSLQQAFNDPVSRRETLDALEVIGVGGAGEDEILAAALSDPSADIRRRGVEVAAAIDKRRKSGAHAATLLSALADKVPSVRQSVLKACEGLPPKESAQILQHAFVGEDLSLRKQATAALRRLAKHAPTLAARAAAHAASHKDALIRQEGMSLLQDTAIANPKETLQVLIDLVANEAAPESSRISALRWLRGASVDIQSLKHVIEKAVSTTASPRLRAAALPLYAQLLDPDAAQELAQTESRGQAQSRAAAAAIWGGLAEQRPEAAAKALRAALFDSSAEVRAEAARSLGALRADGLKLLKIAIMDPRDEVLEGAMESAAQLAEFNAYAVAENLNKALRLVRPTSRPTIIAALAKVGETKSAAVIPALIRAFREGNASARAEAARAFCHLAKEAPQAVSPYLRLAARDTDRGVRGEAALCLRVLAQGDPGGATRMAIELAGASEPSVRLAAAKALLPLVEKAEEKVLPAIIVLLGDSDVETRTQTLKALHHYGEKGLPLGKQAGEVENALATLYSQGDRDERMAAIKAASLVGLPGILRQAAAEGDEATRIAALQGAAALDPPELDLLRAASDDDAMAIRSEAIRLLVSVSDAAIDEVLPVFESLLRSGDAIGRQKAAAALGDMVGAEAHTAALLEGLLGQRSEGVRRAAAEALSAMATRQPALVLPILEQALSDDAHDVRMAASGGLAAAWAAQRSAKELANILREAEADSRRRFVSLEAMIRQSNDPDKTKAVRAALTSLAKEGAPLSRLAARIGLAFVGAPPEELRTFVERLMGAQ